MRERRWCVKMNINYLLDADCVDDADLNKKRETALSVSSASKKYHYDSRYPVLTHLLINQ